MMPRPTYKPTSIFFRMMQTPRSWKKTSNAGAMISPRQREFTVEERTRQSSIALRRLGRRMLIVADVHSHAANHSSRKGESAPHVVEADGRKRISAGRQAVAQERVPRGHGDRDFTLPHDLTVHVQPDAD